MDVLQAPGELTKRNILNSPILLKKGFPASALLTPHESGRSLSCPCTKAGTFLSVPSMLRGCRIPSSPVWLSRAITLHLRVELMLLLMSSQLRLCNDDEVLYMAVFAPGQSLESRCSAAVLHLVLCSLQVCREPLQCPLSLK